jgi:sugar-phosphatase
MLNAVIFDMDGVLVDSHASHTRAWNRLLRLFDMQLTESDIELLRDGRKKEELMRDLMGDRSEDVTQMFWRQKDLFFQEEMKNVTPATGVETLLHELSRASVPMALASSGSQARVHQTLESLRLKGYFSAILTGDDVANGKTCPEIFLKAAEQLGIKPIDVLVFEDSVSGIRSASAAGMKCIGIAGGERAQALLCAGAVTVVTDFSNVSYEQLGQFVAPKNGDYETCSSVSAVG